MNSVLITVLSLSASGSVLALMLIAAKPLLKNRVSRTFAYYIWLVVLLRMIVPVAVPGINVTDALVGHAGPGKSAASYSEPAVTGGSFNAVTIPADTDDSARQTADMDAPGTNAVPAQPTGVQAFLHGAAGSNDLLWIWTAGACLSFLWFAVSYVVFTLSIRRTLVQPHPSDLAMFDDARAGRRVRLAYSSYVQTPVLIGLLRPVIVLPHLAYAYNGMTGDLKNILSHEMTHCRRKDILYKWLVIAITSVHWFNPLMILIRHEIGKACELSCDEAVMRTMTPEERHAYGNTLLALTANKKLPAGILATTLCEGKKVLKERLQNIMRYRKKPVWTVALAIAVALALTGCGVALGAPLEGRDKAVAGTVEAPAVSSLPPSSPSPEQSAASADFDGDGMEDALHLDYQENAFANGSGNLHVSVTLSGGREYEGNDFPGNWITPEPIIADMDGDGRDDIVLALTNDTSTYGATDLYVLRVQDGALSLMSLGGTYIGNDAIAQKQPESFFDENAPCIGASVIKKDGRNLLRVRHLIDMNENTAWYVDALWSGEGWLITDMNTGAAYGADIIHIY